MYGDTYCTPNLTELRATTGKDWAKSFIKKWVEYGINKRVPKIKHCYGKRLFLRLCHSIAWRRQRTTAWQTWRTLGKTRQRLHFGESARTGKRQHGWWVAKFGSFLYILLQNMILNPKFHSSFNVIMFRFFTFQFLWRSRHWLVTNATQIQRFASNSVRVIVLCITKLDSKASQIVYGMHLK